MVQAILLRNGILPVQIRHAFEFGCGVGRVTPHLAAAFARVTACDVSASHLRLARQVIVRGKKNNATLVPAQTQEFGMTASFDLWFSRIVLQHNPPPIIAMILRRMFNLLEPGGVAVFQVPTYCRGYRFGIAEYLANLAGRAQEIEMHILPQTAVFQIAREADCYPLEVREDSATGLGAAWVSNTFVMRKG
jgi:SAM-dependent methyltransferase